MNTSQILWYNTVKYFQDKVMTVFVNSACLKYENIKNEFLLALISNRYCTVP